MRFPFVRASKMREALSLLANQQALTDSVLNINEAALVSLEDLEQRHDYLMGRLAALHFATPSESGSIEEALRHLGQLAFNAEYPLPDFLTVPSYVPTNWPESLQES